MNLKIYLLAGKLPLYEDLIKYPPNGIEYLPRGMINYGQNISTYYLSTNYQLKRKIASIFLNTFKIPIMTYIFNHQSDLIHSTRGILILNRNPWLIDLDYVGYFFGENMFNRKIIERSYLKNIVSKVLSSNYCKKIICWSNAAKYSVINVFKSNKIISDKIEIVYPAIKPIKVRKRKEKDKIKLLYISSSFGPKGGKEVLSVFKFLLKKYDNIELIFKCDVPTNIRVKYDLKEIHYFPYRSQLLSRDELVRRFYMNADIFVYPTFGDLFGLNLLDAMDTGLPIVTTNTFAIPEIVQDGKNGFLIDPPFNWHDKNYLPKKHREYSQKSRSQFVDQLVEKLSLLIEDSSLRTNMGREGRGLVEKGKFSINERNEKLKRIYEEALTK